MKEPVTQELNDLRLDGLLTLMVMTYVRLGDLFVLLTYPDRGESLTSRWRGHPTER